MGLKGLDSYPEMVKKIVDELNPKTYDKLVFQRIDPTTDPQAAKELEKLDIMEINWPAIQQANVEPGKGLIGLLLRNQKDTRVIPILHVLRLPIFGTQYQLADMASVKEEIGVNLDRLVNINEDLGYLESYGTLSVNNFGAMSPQQNDTADVFKRLIEKTYTLKPVQLKDQTIPAGLKCLVIARPTEKFSDYALYQIDQALMRGTNLAIFTDAFKETRPPGQQPFMANQMPSYVPMDTGLQKLLDHYGVRIKKSIVLDENCYRQRRPAQQGGGEQPIYFAPIIQNQHINKSLDYMKNIKGLITLKISPLELDQKSLDAEKVTAHELFASSDKSWEMRDRINFNPMFMQPPASDKEMHSYPLAYLLEGSFSSYFKGKPMPEKPVEKKDEEQPAKEKGAQPDATKPDLSQITEKGTFREQSPPAKILVVASSEMLKDQLLDEDGKSTNAMFVLNMIDVLNGREALAAMRSKVQRFNPLNETSPATKTIIKAVNIAGLPILVIVLGLVIWMHRHTRRKKIQAMFQLRSH